MNLTIYLVFLGLSLFLITIGYFFQAMLLKVLGFSFIFIIHIVTIFSGVSYHTGDTITEINSTVTEVEMNYTNYSFHTISFFMAVLGVVGSTLIYLDHKQEGDL